MSSPVEEHFLFSQMRSFCLSIIIEQVSWVGEYSPVIFLPFWKNSTSTVRRTSQKTVPCLYRLPNPIRHEIPSVSTATLSLVCCGESIINLRSANTESMIFFICFRSSDFDWASRRFGITHKYTTITKFSKLLLYHSRLCRALVLLIWPIHA